MARKYRDPYTELPKMIWLLYSGPAVGSRCFYFVFWVSHRLLAGNGLGLIKGTANALFSNFKIYGVLWIDCFSLAKGCFWLFCALSIGRIELDLDISLVQEGFF